MYCTKCGRMLSGEYEVCRSCGTPTEKYEEVAPSSFWKTLGGYAKLGKRQCRVWLLCLCLAAAVTLLAVASAYIPGVAKKITSTADELIPEKEVVVNARTPIGQVTGTIVTIPESRLGSFTVTSENAYSDDSWERDLLVDGTVKIRLLRFKTVGDEWVNYHIFSLYPDVIEAENFPECDPVSGWAANRIMIAASEATGGCVVEAVRTTDDVYDYLYILEIPEESFADYEETTNQWSEAVMLVDSASGQEMLNPHPVSGSDE